MASFSKHCKYLEENVAALDVMLSAGELQALEAIFPTNATAGLRYPEAVMQMLDKKLSLQAQLNR